MRRQHAFRCHKPGRTSWHALMRCRAPHVTCSPSRPCCPHVTRAPAAAAAALQLFEVLEARAQQLGVAHYGISMPTLEEVFLRASGAAGGGSSGGGSSSSGAASGSGRWQAAGGAGDCSPLRPGSDVNVFLRCSTSSSSRMSTYTGACLRVGGWW
jgi:hypothetical protein